MSPAPLAPDVIVARRAARQLGLVTRDQAVASGLDRNHIQYRLRTGRWQPAAPSVYRVGGAPGSWQQDVLATCLSLGPEAVVSHLSAGALWSVCTPSPRPHLTIPPAANPSPRDAILHRSDVPRADRTRIGPMPVTSLARTLFDCAATVDDQRLQAMVDSAMDRGRTNLRSIRSMLERAGSRGRPAGARTALVAALEPWTSPIQPESPAEARLLRRLHEWGLPAPLLQHEVRGADGRLLGRLDLAWVAPMVGLEYDGMAWHGPRRIEADELRHEALVGAGWAIVRADRLDLRPGVDRIRRDLVDLFNHPRPQAFAG